MKEIIAGIILALAVIFAFRLGRLDGSSPYDLNHDGKVDISDLSILESHFTK